MARVILFGAGASYGSEQVVPYPPPLGSDLFDDLQRVYPHAWGQVPAEKRPQFVPNFEPGMKELWDSGWHGTAVLMRCLADYFARFRPGNGNSYLGILEHLEAHGVLEETCFSTLNYDCLLEYSGRMNGHTILYDSERPTRGQTMTVWKLHGSCNFLPASVSGQTVRVSYSASATKWDGDIRFADAGQVAAFVQQNAFYPAMAVFMEGKPVHSHQGFLQQLQTWWREAVLSAHKVGVIGVRPNVADSHIWDVIAATDAPVVVIGNLQVCEAWRNKYRPSRATSVVGDRFARDLGEFVRQFAA